MLALREFTGLDLLAVEKLFRKDLPLELSAGPRFQIASIPVMFAKELPDFLLITTFFSDLQIIGLVANRKKCVRKPSTWVK